MEKKDKLIGLGIICGTLIILGGMWYLSVPMSYTCSFACDSGKIDVDYLSRFATERYKETDGYRYNFTKYNTEYIPQTFNINEIDGLSCKATCSGSIPRGLISGVMDHGTG